ncbi:hypothetical protein [Pedobacter sp. CFBP9032]|uniref:hypothetical protein n=1 Tax=Pedobacter sp. CFBP9032 TaxID=3096539 RepID=UPI002A6A3DCD|nr:hypothetical protein [Pedobacter sp. CFBP9032]MDY0905636.1 hypothetical protein [Pedobacter sp. CFBP9032]
MENIITLQELNENNERETYRGDDRETVLEFLNAMYQMKQKHDAELKAERDKAKPSNDIFQLIQGLKDELKPVIEFHTTTPGIPKKRLTSKQKLQKQIEDDLKRIEYQSFQRIKKGNV